MKRRVLILALILIIGGTIFLAVMSHSRRHFVENQRFQELNFRQAHPTDVLVYLQQELAPRLRSEEPAFVIHPDLMTELAAPILILDEQAITNLFGTNVTEESATSQDLPLVSLDCTNETLLNILRLMESQGVFRVETFGSSILLKKRERDSQPEN